MSDRLEHYRALARQAGRGAEAGKAGFNATEGRAACLYAERYRDSCCTRVRCHYHADTPLVTVPRACGKCAYRLPPDKLHIAAVIPAWNEGDEVAATVQSLSESIEQARLTVIVIDDGSTDGSCDDLDGATVARHSEPLGVGRSRNAGWELACDAGADVVTFHDAHMRFPPGAIEALAPQALRGDAVLCSKSKGMEHQNPDFCGWGCNLFYNARDGLQAKWRPAPESRAAFCPVPVPMGACYVMSRRTADHLEAATGRLWDDVAGRWGFSEQALAVKAFLLDIPVLVARDVVTRHLYRAANPVTSAGREKWRNVTHVTAILFGRRLFDRHFRPYCERHLSPREVARIADAALGAAPAPRWKRRPDEVFTHLCETNPFSAKTSGKETL